ncbi:MULTISPECIES: YbdK family carboxylate-amine ligase [unclassified Massilia]|uniref:YbdK family carboxylate-amine ligase n=1 Tax=unclassified Massilia TaxID=2609279 RepID=UPI00178351E9|nr:MULTISPECIES: YbdK family carboxylate-amine ligase [unclassified Massilia]MBD8530793.1 glutamate--cysteine ligase [Massilia sp. CFBP 13647]MBD8674492.1 glutamate--cysteine ligase [Massilia sp. CFBP 13721]
MPLEPFTASTPLTFGVELELQLVSLSDFDLTAASPDLLHLLARKPFPGNVTPEITESMIEINSSVHSAYAPLLAELQEIRDTLVAAGDQLNIGIAGGGTHPFQHWSEQKIFSKPRFEHLSSLYGYLAKQFTVFGQHVHIGCGNGDNALYLLHALNRYIPHFIALSASSPFVQGHDSLFDSARLNSVFAFPMSGRAPFTLRWSEFESAYFAKMERTGIIKSMKDFYWDLRPKPEYGTIELRVCDTPLTVERAAALAAYLQALCSYLLERLEEPPVEDDYLVYNYNRFQACRFGLEGAITHPKTYATMPLREDILATLTRMEPYAAALGSLEGLRHLAAAAAGGSDAALLRQQYERQGSVEGMVHAAINWFRGERRFRRR